MIKKIIFSIALSILIGIPALSYQVSTLQPLAPSSYGYSNNYPKVTQVESILFNRTYEQDSIYDRLNRIEIKLFNRVNPSIDLSSRVETIISNIDPGALYNIPMNNLAQIETKLFNNTYANDDIETRIIRMEKEMLGAMQQGNIKERYEIVANAAKHYNAFPPNMPPPGYYSQTPYTNNTMASTNSTSGGVKGFFQNLLGAMAGGALTGFTPPIYNNNSYASQNPYSYNSSEYPNSYWPQQSYPQTSSGFSSNYQTNNGYYNFNKNYGTGSGVHILND